MEQNEFVVYRVPPDVHQRIVAHQQQIAAERGVKLTQVTRAGDTLRYVLALADAAEALNVKPAQPEQAQP